MPQCPHCQEPYEAGQRYCSTCGSFLLHPEEGDTFCPQCGVRVSPRQEFCHECDAPLKGAPAAIAALGPSVAMESPPPPEPAPIPPDRVTPSWVIALLVGVGIVIIILLVLLFTRGMSPPPGPKTEAPAAAPMAPAPTAPAPPATGTGSGPGAVPQGEANIKDNLQGLLTTMREAQLHQDISQFLSVYSPAFPDLDTKKANILRSWQNYEYLNIFYTVDKIREIDPDNAIAWVTWYIDSRNRRTQEIVVSTQTYQVHLAREANQWRIRSLEEMAK